MEILVSKTYLRHNAGTKFYEVIEFCNTSEKLYVLARRWGKTQEFHKGGQTKIESFDDVRKLQDAGRRILEDKGNRGYDVFNSSFGLHGTSGRIDSVEIRSALFSHYGANTVASAIAIGIGADVDESIEAFDPFDARNDVVMEAPEPKPEPLRSNDWSSW